jgi:hypothetical protein
MKNKPLSKNSVDGYVLNHMKEQHYFIVSLFQNFSLKNKQFNWFVQANIINFSLQSVHSKNL